MQDLKDLVQSPGSLVPRLIIRNTRLWLDLRNIINQFKFDVIEQEDGLFQTLCLFSSALVDWSRCQNIDRNCATDHLRSCH